jgi:hypothetical protein
MMSWYSCDLAYERNPQQQAEYSTTSLRMRGLRIPIQSGRVFRLEAGHRSGVKPATIPR